MSTVIQYLTGKFEKASPILFTGAGFSLGAKNMLGEPMPTPDKLRAKIWSLCFPDSPLDQQSTLQNLFETAALRHKSELRDLLVACLTTDANTLPDWYKTFFDMPWHKIYTLNIDDLELATARKHSLQRKIAAVSATKLTFDNRESDKNFLRVIHLNGTLDDLVDNVTFSMSQYAERLAREEPVYVELASELLSHPFVFIGTKLDESPLWQHVELRFSKGGKVKELRPRSYLVTPTLDKARQAVLSQFNVDWVELNAEGFEKVLASVPGLDKGFAVISGRSSKELRKTFAIPDVSELAVKPFEKTDFLLGTEPVWSDIQSGRAIERNNEAELYSSAKKRISNSTPGLIAVTGSAGSGKSTSLLRLALRLVADGLDVGWIGRDIECSTRDLRSVSDRGAMPKVLIVDDVDLVGGDLGSTLREIASGRNEPLVVVGIRAGNIERKINRVQLGGIFYEEHVMPQLSDADIEDLIDVLDRENRLGILKGKARTEQIRLFQQQAGRELLVAMIQATSGERFEVKVCNELAEFEDESRKIYSLIAVASAFRFPLGKRDILVALGDPTNTVLNRLDELVRRKIVSHIPGDNNIYTARHRVIADIIFNKLQAEGVVYELLTGLAKVIATQINSQTPRNSRARKVLNRIVNHDFLHKVLGPEHARNFYAELESNLSFDAHFWLQRGSLEVEFGRIKLAENYLNQAKGLAPEDDFIEAEYDYLLFRKALENPSALEAADYVATARKSLLANIARRGASDPYIYHIYCSQSLSWCFRALDGKLDEQKACLQDLLRVIEDGIKRHPYEAELKSLEARLKDEYFSLAVKK
jgi:hypothetical protein